MSSRVWYFAAFVICLAATALNIGLIVAFGGRPVVIACAFFCAGLTAWNMTMAVKS